MGNSLLGYPGEAYRRGFSWIMAVGFMTSIIVCFHLLVPKLRPLAARWGFVSPGDWVWHRFADDPGVRKLVMGVAVLMAMALANFLFAQLKAMGELAEEVTGGLVPYELGVIGLAATVLFYETRGGMRAVAWTDTVQGLLMLFGLMALLSWLLVGAGGMGTITREIFELRPDAVLVPGGDEVRNWDQHHPASGSGERGLPAGDPARLRGQARQNPQARVLADDLHAAHDDIGRDPDRPSPRSRAWGSWQGRRRIA